jgi:sterol desaturase/sphingolipid hydroxylase (fatty acid hydroxylase superfamily)
MSEVRPPLERWLARTFADADHRRLGSGWISGIASIFLGALAVLAVLAFWFPGVLTSAGFRAAYPIPLFRALLEVTIGVTFLLGAVSLALRRRKVLGLTGIALAIAATLAGGGDVPIRSDFDRRLTLGLDWFILNLLLLALVFVPLERAFPRLPAQTTFRFGWTTDGMHFMVSHLAVQALTFMTLLPATALARFWQPEALRHAIASQPVLLQLVEIVLVADLTQYWIHRAFHRVPWLWRFHAVHHSSRVLDWLAGSRLHVVDVIATRSLVLVPVFLLGFAESALYAYLVFVSFHAVFIHANVRFRFGWLDHVIATPRGHHWHHAVVPVDKNFAVHLPVLDRLFGTQHLPGEAWPEAYGIADHPVPEGWLVQLAYPLRRA